MLHQFLNDSLSRLGWLAPLAAVLVTASPAPAQQIFFEDFETGGPSWTTNAGIWEVGVPGAGPTVTHGGIRCAGTMLNANYPAYDDSRLIYPTPSGSPVQLPSLIGDEELRLRFWSWLSYSSYEAGYVQVSFWDTNASAWSTWEDVPGAKALTGVYGEWHERDVDLTSYAGLAIRLGFYHTASRNSAGHASESTGWYIDDVEIERITPQFSGDFDGSGGDWTVEDGLWEFGMPVAGPAAAHSRPHCTGTNLEGNYQGYRDGRLISPSFSLSPVSGSEGRFLSYYQWWSYSSYDSGKVQISSFDPSTGDWSAWADVSGSYISGVSLSWTQRELNLTAWAGQKVRVAFLHTASRNSAGHASESTGWYIDEVHVTAVDEPISTFCTGDLTTGACPCGNGSQLGANEGCINSTDSGGRLYATGSNVVAQDDLVLHVLQCRPDNFGMFLQGANAISQPLMDGVLCLGNPTRRLGLVLLDGTGSADSSAYSIVNNGSVVPGQTGYYQFWFRDGGVLSACGQNANLTNALKVDWQ